MSEKEGLVASTAPGMSSTARMATTTPGRATTGEAGRVFIAGRVRWGSGVTAAVAGFIGLEVSEWSGAA